MAGTGRHASPDAGEHDVKTSTRQMSREMHIPDARHQANQQDSWGALRLRRQECSHREINGAAQKCEGFKQPGHFRSGRRASIIVYLKKELALDIPIATDFAPASRASACASTVVVPALATELRLRRNDRGHAGRGGRINGGFNFGSLELRLIELALA
jgi:hypothetical protein